MKALWIKRIAICITIHLQSMGANAQDEQKFWIEPKFGYQFPKLEVVNNYIDILWNHFLEGEDLNHFNEVIFPSLSIGWFPLEEHPQWALEFETEYLSQKNTAQKLLANINYDLILSYDAYTVSTSIGYTISVNYNINLMASVGFSILKSTFLAQSEGLVDASANLEDEKVIWKDFDTGLRLKGVFEHKINEDFWVSLNTRYQWLKTDAVLSNKPNGGNFIIANQTLELDLSGFSLSIGLKYKF